MRPINAAPDCARRWIAPIVSAALVLTSSACLTPLSPADSGPPADGSGTAANRLESVAAASSKTAATATASACATGLTGGITATASTGALPGVSRYLCASTAIVPPFLGPGPASGGTTQTFSFAATAPAMLTSLSGTMTFQISGTTTGSYDVSTLTSYVMYGYLNSGFCASPTGTITISSLGAGTAAGTFTASALCDASGTVQYTNVSGSFHIP